MANPLGSENDKTVQRAYSLADIATILEVVALLLTLAGVAAGLVVMTQRAHGEALVGAGISIIVAAAAVGVSLWVLARALRLFGEYVASRLQNG